MSKNSSIKIGTRVEFWFEGILYRGSVVKLKLGAFDVIDWVEVKAEEFVPEGHDGFYPYTDSIDIFCIGVFDKTLEVV